MILDVYTDPTDTDIRYTDPTDQDGADDADDMRTDLIIQMPLKS